MEYLTANHQKVYLDESTREHLSAHPDVYPLLSEAIATLSLPNDMGSVEREVCMGRTVGICTLVTTAPVQFDQETTFVYRKARRYPTRVVTDAQGTACDTITLSLIKKENSEWHLITAYIGRLCPDEPYYVSDKNSPAFKDSVAFWSTHALVYDPAVAAGDIFRSSWKRELEKVYA